MCHGYAFLAFSEDLPLCIINNLQVASGTQKFESHPGHHNKLFIIS